jgi:hypothetical protein
MRVARTLAAAALAVGLTAGLAPAALATGLSPTAPAHSAPTASASSHSASAHSASAHKGKKPAKDRAKLDLHAEDSATAGDTLAFTGRLTHRTKRGFKPAEGRVVTVSLLDPAGSSVVGEATTNAKGRYALSYVTTADQAGSSLRFATSFAGDTTVKAATSKAIRVTLDAGDDGTEDGDGGDDLDEAGGGTQ